MKSVLVIEMLDDIDISKMRIGGDGNIYYIRDGERASILGNIRNIKPLPEPKDIGYPNDDYDVGFASGWDACLKELEK